MTHDQKLYLSTQLIRIGQLTEISRILADLLTKEAFIAMGHKDSIKSIARNMELAQNRLGGMLTDESRKRSAAEVMDEQSVLQTCTLIDLLIAMPKDYRQQLEEKAMAIYEDYCQKAAA